MAQGISVNKIRFVLKSIKAASVGLPLLVLMHGLGGRAEDSAVGKQTLPGHVRPEFARAPLVGTLRNDAVLYIAIGLPLTNPSLLDSKLQEVYDPKSPNFHKFLTPAQFVAQFGASEGDYQALMGFVRANGLTVTETFPDRLLLGVTGNAAAVNRAFHITLITRRRADGSEFYAPDREPSIDLDTKVLDVSGLDNFVVPKRSGQNGTGSGPNGAFGGPDFRNAYASGISLRGEGQSVGLYELDGYYVADIAKYQAQYPGEFPQNNVPQVRVAATLNGFVATSAQSGPPQGGCNATSPSSPGTPPAGTPIGGEATLDIDMTIAIAPGLANVFVYEGCNQDLVLKAMATPNQYGVLPLQLSASWPIPTDASAINTYKQMAMNGQSFLWAVGDGHTTCPIDDGDGQTIRAAMPFVTSVGGTILQMNNNGASWQSETAASDGGGLLAGVPLPNYQISIITDVANPSGWRGVPDVAMMSGDGTNFATSVFTYFKGNVIFNTGTSVAAPLWAGYIALINEKRSQVGLGPLGFPNPSLYALAVYPGQYTEDFNDITTGTSPAPPSSANCTGGVSYSAGPGYDLVTGLGSPKANLINDLASPSPPPPPTNCFVWSLVCGNEATLVCNPPAPGDLLALSGRVAGGNPPNPWTAAGTSIFAAPSIVYDAPSQPNFNEFRACAFNDAGQQQCVWPVPYSPWNTSVPAAGCPGGGAPPSPPLPTPSQCAKEGCAVNPRGGCLCQ
jgi:subtilase family serine protease